MATQSASLWSPASRQETDEVQAQLQKLLASHAFRNSQRYPALLRYVVEETLAGRADQLKERTLGIAVFHRSPDYDSNADPVVRVTAGEVRRRLAQYYQEHADELRIDLPPGSYVPHFHPAEPAAPTPMQLEATAPLPATDVAPPSAPVDPEPLRAAHRRKWFLPAGIAALLLTLVALSAALLLRRHEKREAIERFWAPMTATPQGPLLIIGGRMAVYLAADGTPLADGTALSDGAPLSGSAPPAVQAQAARSAAIAPAERVNTVDVSDALSFARVASMLSRRGSNYAATSAAQTSLEELRASPAVLFGAYNNAWTLHATDRLRYRLRFDLPPGYSHFVWIEDSQKGSIARWGLDRRLPVASMTRDYAIVARYFDQETEQEVVIAAGLRGSGTTAATEFLTSDRYLSQLDAFAPRVNWGKRNLEAVLETEVVGGRSGPPRVVAATFW